MPAQPGRSVVGLDPADHAAVRLEPAAAELTADRLAAAQILAPARPLDFFHPLIGEAVYADQALGARRLAHRRAAAILDRAGEADRVAAHLLATGPPATGTKPPGLPSVPVS